VSGIKHPDSLTFTLLQMLLQCLQGLAGFFYPAGLLLGIHAALGIAVAAVLGAYNTSAYFLLHDRWAETAVWQCTRHPVPPTSYGNILKVYMQHSQMRAHPIQLLWLRAVWVCRQQHLHHQPPVLRPGVWRLQGLGHRPVRLSHNQSKPPPIHCECESGPLARFVKKQAVPTSHLHTVSTSHLKLPHVHVCPPGWQIG
jgi:hypothetical protein